MWQPIPQSEPEKIKVCEYDHIAGQIEDMTVERLKVELMDCLNANELSIKANSYLRNQLAEANTKLEEMQHYCCVIKDAGGSRCSIAKQLAEAKEHHALVLNEVSLKLSEKDSEIERLKLECRKKR
jgi:capsule polysaccharide export protein KpsE/RkpR